VHKGGKTRDGEFLELLRVSALAAGCVSRRGADAFISSARMARWRPPLLLVRSMAAQHPVAFSRVFWQLEVAASWDGRPLGRVSPGRHGDGRVGVDAIRSAANHLALVIAASCSLT